MMRIEKKSRKQWVSDDITEQLNSETIYCQKSLYMKKTFLALSIIECFFFNLKSNIPLTDEHIKKITHWSGKIWTYDLNKGTEKNMQISSEGKYKHYTLSRNELSVFSAFRSTRQPLGMRSNWEATQEGWKGQEPNHVAISQIFNQLKTFGGLWANKKLIRFSFLQFYCASLVDIETETEVQFTRLFK